MIPSSFFASKFLEATLAVFEQFAENLALRTNLLLADTFIFFSWVIAWYRFFWVTLSLFCLTAVFSSVSQHFFKAFLELFFSCLISSASRANCVFFWHTMVDDRQMVPEAWGCVVSVTKITLLLLSHTQLFLTEKFPSIDFEVRSLPTKLQLTVDVLC